MEIVNLLRDIGVFGLAGFFIQQIIIKSTTRKVEAFKSELDQKTREFQTMLDNKIELYRAELNFKNFKSTKIYEKQLNIIIDLHKKLVKLNYETQEMMTFLKPVSNSALDRGDEGIKNAAQAYNDLNQFVQDNLIFIPEILVAKLNNIRNDYFSSYWDFTFGHRYGINNDFTTSKSLKASEEIKEKIQPAIDQIVTDFRLLIGSEKH